MARLLLLAALPLLVGFGGPLFHDDATKVRGFEPPPGWEPLPVGSYPRLRGLWERRDGSGRLTLVANHVAAGSTARGLLEQSRPVLVRQGLTKLVVKAVPPAGDGTDRVELEGVTADGRRSVRQLYVVSGDMGYVLTMVGPLDRAAQLQSAFAAAAPSLSVGDEPATAAPRR